MRARFDSLTRRLLVLTTISTLGLFPAAAFAQTARIELHPLQTVTLTGEQFLTGVKDGKSALILMDIQLPGISGIEALQRLRADPVTGPIPVIAVTASVMTQDRTRIM